MNRFKLAFQILRGKQTLVELNWIRPRDKLILVTPDKLTSEQIVRMQHMLESQTNIKILAGLNVTHLLVEQGDVFENLRSK